MLNATGLAGDEPEDSYLWLEDVTGARSLAWVKERNAESMKELTRSPDFRALERRILQILDSEDRIPVVQKLGHYYYNFWRDGKNPRGLWRRTTLEEYKKAKPAWEIVLDLDRLGQGREGKLGLAWCSGAQARLPASTDLAVARRRRRERGPGIRPDRKDVRERRIHAARGQEPGCLARSRQRVRGHRFRPGLADRIGLSSHRQGMEAGHAADRGGA